MPDQKITELTLGTPADTDVLPFVDLNTMTTKKATKADLKGATGAAATIAVGTVTTGSAGTNVIINNSGSSSAAVFDFTIPRGDTGATGPTGPMGSVAGSNTQVQFNDSSVFGGDAGFTYNKTTDIATLGGLDITGSNIPPNGVYLSTTNTIVFSINSAGEVQLTSAALSPFADGGSALGTTSLRWNGANFSSASVLNWANGNATLTHSTGFLTSNVPLTASSFIPSSSSAPTNGMYLSAANTLGWSVNSAAEMTLTASALSPAANDGNALGTTSLSWADLFLASGGVINFANSNYTLTHSTNFLTANTDFRITTTGTNAASVPTIGSTNTLTNKRITKRTGTVASNATPTINSDNVDYFSVTALAVDITSFTTNLSGTPTNAQTLWISITGTATRAIAWGSSFESSGTVSLPTTTSGTNRLDVLLAWNTVTSKWRCLAWS